MYIPHPLRPKREDRWLLDGFYSLEQVGRAASLLDTGLLSLRQLADMAIEGVLWPH